ncbi:MAG: NUDIX domain-containing protein [Lachnospiraceae bacterium]|nr:NUDIX domain-containing protein [Lachnospiraceae bacterium]
MAKKRRNGYFGRKMAWVQVCWFISGCGLFAAAVCALTENDLVRIADWLGLAMLVAGSVNVFIATKKRQQLCGSHWLLADGLCTALFSLFPLFNQIIQAAMIPFFFGIWELVTGVLKMIDASELRRERIRGWKWFTAVGSVEIVSGVAELLKPVEEHAGMHILVAIIFFIQGISYILKIVVYPRLEKEPDGKQSEKEMNGSLSVKEPDGNQSEKEMDGELSVKETKRNSPEQEPCRHLPESAVFMNMCMLCNGDLVLALDKTGSTYNGTTFPGGHVEAGETFSAAVIREMKEETGLIIHHPVLKGIYHWYRDGMHNIGLMYRAESFEGDLKSSEEGRVYWISREEYAKKELAAGMPRVLQIMDDENITECFEEVDADGKVLERLF